MDGDAWWSLGALAGILKNMGKTIKAINDCNVPPGLSDFWDPKWTTNSPISYKFGWALTASGNMYQFAATMEESDGSKKALVRGLFLKNGTAEWLIMASGSTNSWTWVENDSTTYFPY